MTAAILADSFVRVEKLLINTTDYLGALTIYFKTEAIITSRTHKFWWNIVSTQPTLLTVRNAATAEVALFIINIQ